ncbi:MAG: DUF1326 domain-containing protein [Acetobacteraceae bacterium]
MAEVNWRLEGEWIKDCNCAFGCPCDFNALPTYGDCRAVVGMHITKGHFDATSLDGLSFVMAAAFPGPLHEGNGEAQPIIDERASPGQREALFNILSGKYSAPGTLFQIFSVIISKFYDPIAAPIRFEFDLAGRRAKISVPGVLEVENEPIRNPVTGAPHRIQIVMPEGFEHHGAEISSARIACRGAVKVEVDQGHGSLARVTQTPAGVAG